MHHRVTIEDGARVVVELTGNHARDYSKGRIDGLRRAANWWRCHPEAEVPAFFEWLGSMRMIEEAPE